MKLALKEAKKAFEIDEVPVGAIAVDAAGNILSTGHNQTIGLNDPSAHAEIIAIRKACSKISNYRLKANLYVTIEPCIMCIGAIIHARIPKVIFGASDPKWGGIVSLYNMASDNRLNHKVDFISGICLDESKKIIQDFFRLKRRLK